MNFLVFSHRFRFLVVLIMFKRKLVFVYFNNVKLYFQVYLQLGSVFVLKYIPGPPRPDAFLVALPR